ncbi:hypothetical protein [uncultured Parasphingopyxis sp.]|uniref:hypothetical protein n=1 Tax=uncultured Parasphingopyxis sp. TaxID=1547918 RepID=UPI002623C7B9|nr:hypothetical protein [uncultured Parasphingopyxis sp.]
MKAILGERMAELRTQTSQERGFELPPVTLTPRQAQHYPFFERNGGIIVGNVGEAIGLPAGTRISPAAVTQIDGPSIIDGAWWGR